MSFTKNPMNPIMQKPIAVATAIFWNSEIKKKIGKKLNTIKKNILQQNKRTLKNCI